MTGHAPFSQARRPGPKKVSRACDYCRAKRVRLLLLIDRHLSYAVCFKFFSIRLRTDYLVNWQLKCTSGAHPCMNCRLYDVECTSGEPSSAMSFVSSRQTRTSLRASSKTSRRRRAVTQSEAASIIENLGTIQGPTDATTVSLRR